MGRAKVALARAHIDEAEGELKAARFYVEERQMREYYPLLSLVSGQASLARGRNGQALNRFRVADKLAAGMTLRPLIWRAQAGAARAAAALGDPEAADKHWKRAHGTIEEIGALIEEQMLRESFLENNRKKLATAYT